MALLTPTRFRQLRLAAVRSLAAWCAATAVVPRAAAQAPAQTAISAENQVKAVFLFNFAQFLAWPPGAFRSPQSPIVIGVLGDDPFGPYLDRVVQGERIGERPLVVRRYRRPEDAAECSILFISRSEAGEFDTVMARLKGRSLLTVGDFDGFARLGGMVRFVTENGKIRLRINVLAAKAAGLTISSKLLAHATIVSAGDN
jgi:hypothetical protein